MRSFQLPLLPISSLWLLPQEAAASRRVLHGVGLRVAARLRQRALALAWSAWADHVESQRGKAEKLRRSVAAWRQRSLRATLARWRVRTQVALLALPWGLSTARLSCARAAAQNAFHSSPTPTH